MVGSPTPLLRASALIVHGLRPMRRSVAHWVSSIGWFERRRSAQNSCVTRLTTSTSSADAWGRERGTRVYFDVDDIEAGAAKVKELGGEAGDALPVPSMGWFAVCKDVEGNEFGLWQTDPAASMPE